ncbi:hypothetical protein M426DRAFT_10022 [Hypoxylon sp. CI-4A]|nr:hypothetical protein M426DRAFT_10022 [Hypoxylon sp. CI-4A]
MASSKMQALSRTEKQYYVPKSASSPPYPVGFRDIVWLVVVILCLVGSRVSSWDPLQLPWAVRPTQRECNISIKQPSISDANILSFKVQEKPRPSAIIPVVPGSERLFRSSVPKALTFCEVKVAYYHKGHNETINVQIALPLDGWNGRFMGTGGGGWSAGFFGESLYSPMDRGFAAAATDAGHQRRQPATVDKDWAFTHGKPNLHSLQDFASTALRDMTEIGQQVASDFYQEPVRYSYWGGCSTGGRQGLMLAQQYPTLYDGILAPAPALNFDLLLTFMYYPQLVMNQMRQYPNQCELRAIQTAFIKACDGQDGLVDGIISAPDRCAFDAHAVVGKDIFCEETNTTIPVSLAAAQVANATYTGPLGAFNTPLYYGLAAGAPFNTVANTVALPQEGHSLAGAGAGRPTGLDEEWMRIFLLKNLSYDIGSLSLAEFNELGFTAMKEYGSIISTLNPDLSTFASLGHKMITWHGLQDGIIPHKSTEAYYRAVKAVRPDVEDFFRYYEAPGVMHCFGGDGPYPGNIHTGGGRALDSLIDWVENGVAPETLLAASSENGPDGEPLYTRPLCPWPRVAKYIGGDPRSPGSFQCDDGF